jgi:hypothetical protein
VSERKPAVKWGAWTSSSPSAGAGGIPVLALSVQGRPRPKPGKIAGAAGLLSRHRLDSKR